MECIANAYMIKNIYAATGNTREWVLMAKVEPPVEFTESTILLT
jgi:hypothetical protein